MKVFVVVSYCGRDVNAECNVECVQRSKEGVAMAIERLKLEHRQAVEEGWMYFEADEYELGD